MVDQQTEKLIASLPLSSDEVKALRHADTIVFWHQRTGQGRIDAVKKRVTDGFDDDLRKVLFVDSRITDYAREKTGEGHSVPTHERSYTAIESISFPRSHDIWRTIVDIIKPGDVLMLDWQAANTNIAMDTVDMTMDSLRLVVMRGDKRWMFHVEERIVERHSTARMVRRER